MEEITAKYAESSGIDETILDEYYLAWAHGSDEEALERQTLMSGPAYQRKYPYFVAYCRERADAEALSAMDSGNLPNVIRRTSFLEEALLAEVSSGMNLQQACSNISVPYITVAHCWMKDPVFAGLIKDAVASTTAKTVKALYHKAWGVSRKRKSVTTMTDAVGNVLNRSTTVTDENIPADINAIKFVLTNRDPEKWTEDKSSNPSKDKGLILNYINSQAQALTTEQIAEFDKQQEDYDNHEV